MRHAHVFHAGGIFAPTPLTTAHQHHSRCRVVPDQHLLRSTHSASPTPSSRCSDSTQLNSTRLNSTFSCRVVIINSISIFLDFVGLHVLSYAHVDSSTASHRHCVQRGGLICKCIQRHPPPLTLITLHNFHTATPRLRKRLLTNRRASTLFVAPFPRGTLSKSRQ